MNSNDSGMATVVMTSDLRVILFESDAQARAWEARQSGGFVVSQAKVRKADHYRGKIGRNGAIFTREDQSTPQLVAALNNAE